MTRIVGPTGSRRRRRLLLVPILFTAALALFWVGGAQAVHKTGAFELDGNATNDPSTSGDDWDNVCFQYASPLPSGGCGTTTPTTGSTSGSWSSDGNLNSTIFTGGGSKDPIDISSWNWKDGAGGLPDKDNLLHAFAARYSQTPSTNCPAGTFPTCEVIYFGMDRFDNSGDAQNGFWFLQNNVNTVAGKTNTFSGVHKNGDVLVVSDFSIGGTTSTITVYTWDSTCTAAGKPDAGCADSNLRQQETSDAANCASAADNDGFCGITNPAGTAVPWSGDFTDKSGNTSTYAQGELYEAGINLSTLGLAGECFSSMVAESRSSTATSAVLKDFVLAHFPQCKPHLATQASSNGTVAPGTAVHDTATITVSGGTNAPDPTGTVTFFLCGPSATGNPDCTTDGTNIGTGTLGDAGENPTTPNDGKSHADSPDVNTSTANLMPGYYCFRAEWPGDSNYPGTLKYTDSGNECFRVQDTSSMTTAQDWLPNDSATITSAHGTALTGNVVFTLYDGAITCASGGTTVLYGPETKTLSGAASGTSVSTSNTSTKITVANGRTVTWKVVFTSTDSGVASPANPTCETTTLTISN